MTATVPAFLSVLESIGVQGQMLVAAALGLGALYMVRLARVGGLAVGALSTAGTIAVAIFVVGAVATALGWITVNPVAVAADALSVLPWLLDTLAELLARLIRLVADYLPG